MQSRLQQPKTSRLTLFGQNNPSLLKHSSVSSSPARERVKLTQTQTERMQKQPSKHLEDDEVGSRKGAASPQDSSSGQGSRASSPQKGAKQGGSGLLDVHLNRDEKNKSNRDTEGQGVSISSSTARGDEGTKVSAESASDKLPRDGSLPKKPKKDKSNLRKGKWTVEEEEYTSRIIHYFGTGLLTLPEGSTLRSYLADKLNCDPMRITKKYAGASCLGRRAHQFRGRATPTVAEIQLAKAELDHLEQRFRMRVEEGYSSLPLSPSPDTMFSLSHQANPFLMNPTANTQQSGPTALAPWLLGLGLNPPQQHPHSAPSSSPRFSQGYNSMAEQSKTIPGIEQLSAALPFLLPNTTGSPAPPMPQPPTVNSTGIPNMDAALASWAFAQAAASLAPAISQLAAANLEQQRQMQQSPKPPPVDPMKELSARLQQTQETEKLRAALQAAMAGAPNSSPPPLPAGTSSQSPATQVMQSATAPARQRQMSRNPQQRKRKEPPTADSKPTATPKSQQAAQGANGNRSRTAEDQKAGDILLGFLSSLRQSYEEAVKEKESEGDQPQISSRQQLPATTSLQDAVDSMKQRQRARPAQVSDISSGVSSSTGQPESSLEESDWHSDKKTETSSSEDSDKEVSAISSGKGPPRKRLKTKRAADERQRAAST